MTIEEAAQSYGLKKTTALVDDSIVFMVRRIYNGDSSLYFRILRVLNPRVNWLQVPAGTAIYYLPEEAITSDLQ